MCIRDSYNIEVEDDVTAFMEYDNGATGLFITCTAEAPGTNRLEISGSRGKVVIESDKITFWPVSYTHLDVYKRQMRPGPR